MKVQGPLVLQEAIGEHEVWEVDSITPGSVSLCFGAGLPTSPLAVLTLGRTVMVLAALPHVRCAFNQTQVARPARKSPPGEEAHLLLGLPPWQEFLRALGTPAVDFISI